MMFGNTKTHRIFGPKIRRPSWHSVPVQRGEGLGSFFAKMGRRLLPLAKKAVPLVSKGIKKITESKTAQDIGKSLMERGADAAAEIASNIVLGSGSNTDSLSLAQERLAAARADIAKIIRQAPKRAFSESDNSDIDVPIKRQKEKRKKKKQTSKTTRNKKKYNLLKNIS